MSGMVGACLRRKTLLIGKLVLTLSALAGIRSLPQAGTTAPSDSATPVTTSSPVFEVSTIKRNKSGGGNSGTNTQNGRFTASNVSLKSIIEYQAYGVPEPRILGGPKWLNSERFDIQAKCDSSVADKLKTLDPHQAKIQTQAMFQQLLADRFKLATHWETRTLPAYALVVAKNGSLLHETKEPEGASETSIGTSGSSAVFTAKGVTVAELAEELTQELSSELGRVVLDHTQIKGRYDVTLKWTPEAETHSTAMEGSVSANDSDPPIFTAIQEQLGLKLESTHGPVPVLVIDYVELPSEN
jgi:uncharacterized protein (TIGR03435 family)